MQLGGSILPILAALALLTGCHLPTHDQSKLKAIQAESERLFAAHPIEPSKGWADIPKNQWPPVIKSLHPYSVTVFGWGVDITTKPYFDGGWGYEVPQGGKHDLPMPAGCYSELGHGVFWHGLC